MAPGLKEIERIVREIAATQKEMRIEQGEQGGRLIRVEDQVKFTNGKVTKVTADADQLFKINNDQDRVIEALKITVEQVKVDLGVMKTCMNGLEGFKDKMGGMGIGYRTVGEIILLIIAVLAFALKP